MPVADVTKRGDALEPFFVCELPTAIRSALWDLLREAAQRRRLTRTEIKLRCAIRPQPWRDLGCDRSTFYRRRKRALLRESGAQDYAPDVDRIGRDGKSYSIRRVAS